MPVVVAVPEVCLADQVVPQEDKPELTEPVVKVVAVPEQLSLAAEAEAHQTAEPGEPVEV